MAEDPFRATYCLVSCGTRPVRGLARDSFGTADGLVGRCPGGAGRRTVALLGARRHCVPGILGGGARVMSSSMDVLPRGLGSSVHRCRETEHQRQQRGHRAKAKASHSR